MSLCCLPYSSTQRFPEEILLAAGLAAEDSGALPAVMGSQDLMGAPSSPLPQAPMHHGANSNCFVVWSFKHLPLESQLSRCSCLVFRTISGCTSGDLPLSLPSWEHPSHRTPVRNGPEDPGPAMALFLSFYTVLEESLPAMDSFS